MEMGDKSIYIIIEVILISGSAHGTVETREDGESGNVESFSFEEVLVVEALKVGGIGVKMFTISGRTGLQFVGKSNASNATAAAMALESSACTWTRATKRHLVGSF